VSVPRDTTLGADLLRLFRDDFARISERLEERGVALLETPSAEVVAELFRDLHTLKGNSQAVGLEAMGTLSHALEEVLDGLRAHGREADAEIGRLLLEANDAFRGLVGGTQQALPDGLLERVRRLAAREPAAPAGAVRAASPGERAPSQLLSIPVEAERVSALLDAAERLRAGLLTVGDTRLSADAEEMTRMLVGLGRMPLSRIVPRLRRVAIETADALGREVRLVVEGEEVHADAAVVQELGSVLPHLLRNAIDHGIEPPDERVECGKTPEGTLRLRFAIAADGLRIEVDDDGRGMDGERIVASAVARGIIGEAEASRLGKEDRLRLIFAAGLSTRDDSDAISGRGVGMDAVAAAVERHRGSI
jgi:two-component system, chemotaxis family, sensor kinase CheA